MKYTKTSATTTTGNNYHCDICNQIIPAGNMTRAWNNAGQYSAAVHTECYKTTRAIETLKARAAECDNTPVTVNHYQIKYNVYVNKLAMAHAEIGIVGFYKRAEDAVTDALKG